MLPKDALPLPTDDCTRIKRELMEHGLASVALAFRHAELVERLQRQAARSEEEKNAALLREQKLKEENECRCKKLEEDMKTCQNQLLISQNHCRMIKANLKVTKKKMEDSEAAVAAGKRREDKLEKALAKTDKVLEAEKDELTDEYKRQMHYLSKVIIRQGYEIGLSAALVPKESPLWGSYPRRYPGLPDDFKHPTEWPEPSDATDEAEETTAQEETSLAKKDLPSL